jgi:hypothetical protein
MTVPTGLSIAGSPITSSGTLAVTFASGYSIPTNASQTNWDTAYSWGNPSGVYLPLIGGTLSGTLQVGSPSATATANLAVTKTITGGTAARGILSDGVIQSDVTSSAYYYQSKAYTAAGSYTIALLSHYRAEKSSIGASSVVTTQIGFNADNSLGTTTGGYANTNYGFYGNLSTSGSSTNYNVYMAGTAYNYFQGITGIGATPSGSYTLDVTGTGRFTSTLLVNNNASVIKSGSSLTTLGQSRYLNLSDYYGLNTSRVEIGLGYSAATGITYTPALIGFVQTTDTGYTYGDLYFATRSVTTDTAPTVRLTIASTGAASFSSIVGVAVTAGGLGGALDVQGTNNSYTSVMKGGTTTSQSFGLDIRAGTNSSDIALQIKDVTSTLTYFKVRGDGKVGVGTSGGTYTLELSGTLGVSGAATFSSTITGNADIVLNAYSGYGSGSGNFYYNGTLGRIVFNEGIGATTATFSSSVTATSDSTLFKEGFIVKATTTGGGGSQPAYTYYTAAGSKRWSTFLNVGDDKFHIANASNSELFTITQTGNVGIGTSSPASLLSIQRGASGDNMEIIGSGASGYSDILFYNTNKVTRLGYIDWSDTQARWNVEANIPLILYTSGLERMRISAAGDIAIGADTNSLVRLISRGKDSSTTNYAFIAQNSATTNLLVVRNDGAVAVYGAFSKGSGSFKIDHPLESMTETHNLVHSFVESPQANNIYRGKVELVNGKAKVNLDEVSTMTEGTFVALNREIHTYTSNETDWDAVIGNVEGNILTIECQNNQSNAIVSWLVIGERQDKHIMDTAWTDDNGRVIVEPLKEIEII